MKISQILSTPYVFEIESVPNERGIWECHAAYGELPGCSVIDPKPLPAIDRLEELRLNILFSMIENNEAVPIPRKPFPDRYFALTTEPVEDMMRRIGLGHWLDKLDADVAVRHTQKWTPDVS